MILILTDLFICEQVLRTATLRWRGCIEMLLFARSQRRVVMYSC